MRIAALSILAVLATGAAEAPDAPVPVPMPRPEVDAPEKPDATPPKAGDAAKPAVPDGKTPGDADAEAAGSSPTPPGDAACEAELEALGVAYERIAPVTGEGGCGVSPAYRVTGLGDGVALEPAAEMGCRTALSLARLTSEIVVPAVAALDRAEEKSGRSLKAVRQASAYVCRSRNNRAGAKLSEHATGTAIDLSAFVLSDGTEIAISPRDDDHTIHGAFQAAVHGGACLHFSTVLGPGADAHHADHLHLDLAERRGGYRICQ